MTQDESFQADRMTRDELLVVEPRAAGLDVHKMQVTASVRLAVANSPPLAAVRVFPSDPPGLAELTGWLRGHGVTAATMEGTGVYWETPYRALEAAGIRPQLVHAQHVKQIKGRKTDVSDSLWLARICQLGLAQPSYVPPPDFSALRQMCRYRRKIVADRARIRNRIQKTLDREGLRVGGILADLFGRNGRIVLDGLVEGHGPQRILGRLTPHVRAKADRLARVLQAELEPHSLWRLRGLLQDFDAIAERIEELDRRVERAFADHRRTLDMLETLPGVARCSAHAILAELGPEPTKVFPKVQSLTAWAGLCPGNNESAGKRSSGRIRRGNPMLRVTLTECAHGAARTKGSQFHGYHRALTARFGYKRATTATAHKLLRVIYAMLRDDHPYVDPLIDYEKLFVGRNASRWLRMLARHDFLPLQPQAAA